MKNPFTECLNECNGDFTETNGPWADLRLWLRSQAERFNKSPRFAGPANPARAVIELGGRSLAMQGQQIRSCLLVLAAHLDAQINDAREAAIA
jgi:hypothetical protein